MNEFNNRIDAQRAILTSVNARGWKEELLGLSSGALERWVRANQLMQTDPLVVALYKAAEKLFFLANKSQEQVTNEYRGLSIEVSKIAKEIHARVNRFPR